MHYQERLWAPASWWVIGLFFAVSFATAVGFALGPAISLAGGGLTTALVAGGLLWYGGSSIVVDEDSLRVGRYRLEAEYLGEVLAHTAGETRERLGRDADRRALLVMRGYIPTSVEVAIADPADPHPYWLVSTRRPDDLAQALVRLRDRMPR